MITIMDAIARAMGWILKSLYEATANYGLAIILFTLFIKLITIPLSLKQQRSMKETQEIQPIMKEIQEKYKDNPEKQTQELTKIYQERKINPFAGCLLVLIQFPIIYAMFFAIAEPVKFMYPEIKTAEVEQAIAKYEDKGYYKEMYYLINDTDILNTDFLTLDLGTVPDLGNINMWKTWLIPILSGAATFFTSFISMKQSKQSGGGAAQAEGMQRSMMIFMPIMIIMISFKVPLGMSLYWFVNTLISILLQLWMTSKLKTDDKKPVVVA